MSDLRGAFRDAYGVAAGAWASGPAQIYRRMADVLVAASPVPLTGARVLDFGAGTGATSAAIVEAGARVVGADLSPDMLLVDRKRRPPAVACDVGALPFAGGTFDLAMGAFVLSHVPDPARALTEVARTTRPGGVVMTLGFDGRWSFAAKDVVETVLGRFGYRRPAWYEEFKTEVEPLTAFPERLHSVARNADLVDVVVDERAVDVDVRTTEDIVAWRLDMPSYAPFVATLGEAERDRLLDALHEAIGPTPEPLVPHLLVMTGRVPAS